MRYTAAYLLAVLGGNPSPDIASIAKILDSVGIECDEKRAQQVVDACQGRNVDDIIADGMKKIDQVSTVNTPAITTNDKQLPKDISPVPACISRDPSPPGSPGNNSDFFGLFD